MHEKNIFLDKPMITSSHFNRLYRSLRQSFVNISSTCKLQYLNQTVGYCMPETTISQRSLLADYFDDQNKSVQQHWIVARWQHLLVAPTRIFLREGLLTQADCSSRDSRLSLLSAYCLTLLMLCVWRCRQRLYATAGDSEFCPPGFGSAKVLTFFFCFFTAILIPKK